MSLSRIPSVVSALTVPVLVIGADKRVQAVNEQVELILGPNLVGRHYITALRQPSLIAAVDRAVDTSDPQVARYTGRDGARDTSFRVTVARAEADVVLTFEDQTAAQEAEQMRRDFVANVSHELRTPLTALLGFIETLRGAARDDAVARDRFLGIMSHEANRMTRLVDDLLSLSRVEEGARVRPREQVDLGSLLSSVIEGLVPQAQEAGVAVSLDLPPQTEIIPGDAGQLIQVFTNLVENALKYGAGGGVVDVCLKPRREVRRLRGQGVQILVSDKGEGVAPHHIARLTERFYRVDNHRSRQVGGTGLGLAIVKHIVNRHRGHLVVKSELGQGTDISVFLPTSGLS